MIRPVVNVDAAMSDDDEDERWRWSVETVGEGVRKKNNLCRGEEERPTRRSRKQGGVF